MAFQEFSKNYSNILMIPLFEHLLFHHFQFEIFFLFRFKWKIIRIIRNINNNSITTYKWFTLSYCHKTSKCFEIIVTTSMFFWRSISLLFIWLMQSVNGPHFLSTTFLLLLLWSLLFLHLGLLLFLKQI